MAAMVGVALEEMVDNTMSGCHMVRGATLGPISPSFDPTKWITDILDRTLTPDTWKKVQLFGERKVSF